MTDTNLIITKPDDWHVHLRDDLLMQAVIEDTAINFARAVVMPNLNPPILNVQDALSYRDRLVNAIGLLINKKRNLKTEIPFGPYIITAGVIYYCFGELLYSIILVV